VEVAYPGFLTFIPILNVSFLPPPCSTLCLWDLARARRRLDSQGWESGGGGLKPDVAARPLDRTRVMRIVQIGRTRKSIVEGSALVNVFPPMHSPFGSLECIPLLTF